MFCVQIFFVIVTRNVDGVDQAKICGKLRERSCKRHRMRGVHGTDDSTQTVCHGCQTLGIGAQGIVQTLGFWLVGVVIACHDVKAWMAVRVVGIINLVADAPKDNARMIAVAPYQICEVALMPHREICIIAFMSWGIDIVSLPPFIFGPLPLIKCFINHQKS